MCSVYIKDINIKQKQKDVPLEETDKVGICELGNQAKVRNFPGEWGNLLCKKLIVLCED